MLPFNSTRVPNPINVESRSSSNGKILLVKHCLRSLKVLFVFAYYYYYYYYDVLLYEAKCAPDKILVNFSPLCHPVVICISSITHSITP